MESQSESETEREGERSSLGTRGHGGGRLAV